LERAQVNQQGQDCSSRLLQISQKLGIVRQDDAHNDYSHLNQRVFFNKLLRLKYEEGEKHITA